MGINVGWSDLSRSLFEFMTASLLLGWRRLFYHGTYFLQLCWLPHRRRDQSDLRGERTFFSTEHGIPASRLWLHAVSQRKTIRNKEHREWQSCLFFGHHMRVVETSRKDQNIRRRCTTNASRVPDWWVPSRSSWSHQHPRAKWLPNCDW